MTIGMARSSGPGLFTLSVRLALERNHSADWEPAPAADGERPLFESQLKPNELTPKRVLSSDLPPSE